MTLDITTHKTILFQILKDIYSDTTISPFLGLKGGTAALMFYGLDRFKEWIIAEFYMALANF